MNAKSSQPELFNPQEAQGRKPLDLTVWNAVKARIMAKIAEDDRNRCRTPYRGFQMGQMGR